MRKWKPGEFVALKSGQSVRPHSIVIAVVEDGDLSGVILERELLGKRFWRHRDLVLAD